MPVLSLSLSFHFLLLYDAKKTLSLNQNSLDLVQRDFVGRAVVKFCCAGRLVGGNLLGMFQCAAVRELCRDTGGPERVTADGVARQNRQRQPE